MAQPVSAVTCYYSKQFQKSLPGRLFQLVIDEFCMKGTTNVRGGSQSFLGPSDGRAVAKQNVPGPQFKEFEFDALKVLFKKKTNKQFACLQKKMSHGP